jgi:hypothetical protein
MSRNRTALRTQKRKAIRLDLPAAQQYLEQRVHVQIADLVLNILRNVALPFLGAKPDIFRFPSFAHTLV